MSTAVEKREPTTVSAYIKSPQMVQGLTSLLGSEDRARRFARAVVTTIQANPKLLNCDKTSFQIACMHSAFANLPPGPLGLAAIIPYGKEAQFQAMYRGIVQLLWRSDQIATIESDLVYEGDKFRKRIGQPPIHEPGDHYGDFAHATGVYATIGIKGGGWITEHWPASKICAHRDRYSKAYNYAESPKGKKDSPWHTAPEAMWKKTVLKQAAKLAPISEEAQQAISADDMAEAGVPVIDIAERIQERSDETLDALEAQIVAGQEPTDDGKEGATGEGAEMSDGPDSPTPTTQDDENTSTPGARDARTALREKFEKQCKAIKGVKLDLAYEVLLDVSGVTDKRGLTAEHYQDVIEDMASFITFYEERKARQAEEPEPVAVTADEINFDG